MPLVVKWNRQALKQFDEAVAYIEKASTINAEKFARNILNKTDLLLEFPEKYPPTNLKSTTMGASEHLNCSTIEFRTDIRTTKYASSDLGMLN